MTLDEAIKHAEEVAEGYEEDISKWEYTLSEYRKRECVEQTTIPRCEKALNKCKQCVSEHRQLAEWLKDYKRLKEQSNVPDINDGDIISRQAVLDTLSELNAISFYEAQEDSKEAYYEIRQAIKNLQSVKPQESCDVPDTNDGKMSENSTGSESEVRNDI